MMKRDHQSTHLLDILEAHGRTYKNTSSKPSLSTSPRKSLQQDMEKRSSFGCEKQHLIERTGRYIFTILESR
jgi:hypothetical protein